MLVEIIVLICLFNEVTNSNSSTNLNTLDIVQLLEEGPNNNISQSEGPSKGPIVNSTFMPLTTLISHETDVKSTRFAPFKTTSILKGSPIARLPKTDNEDFLQNPRYYDNDELAKDFRKLEKEYPKIARLSTVGRSVKNRNIWVLHINSNPRDRKLLTPIFKFVANMHGDETVGRQMLIYLAHYLVINYSKNERVTWLVDNTDIYLVPTMNPDGYANSQEGLCESKIFYTGRNNERAVDLNRDFPDQFDNKKQNTRAKRQPETVIMMNWIRSKPFVLSGNLHGGAVVASYPYDNSNTGSFCCLDSKTPDNALFKQLALLYAERNPVMKQGNACGDNFPKGITNGAHWYVLSGGMQDFNYVRSNCFEITFELSCCKFPMANTLTTEWNNNKESMLRFMEATHWGAKGMVMDSLGKPIANAVIVVKGIDHNITSSNRGEYWRLLLPGKYTMYAAATGYDNSATASVNVEKGKTATHDFRLNPATKPGQEAQQGNSIQAQIVLIIILITISFILN